ncbi:MAG: formylglycine-generating enzyme family protein [Pseudomonadota bacterium]
MRPHIAAIALSSLASLLGCTPGLLLSARRITPKDTADTRASPNDTADTATEPIAAIDRQLGMVGITAGAYIAGSPKDEVGRLEFPDERQRQITLTRDFLIGATTVTEAVFEAWMGYQPSPWDPCPTCPQVAVTWEESALFLNRLSEAAGLELCYACEGEGEGVDAACVEVGDPYACSGYRLPTEAEWEYAVRAGSTGAFSTGGSLPPGAEEDCDPELRLTDGSLLTDLAWYCEWAEDIMTSCPPHPVGLKQPNAWGLFDVAGNVFEWLQGTFDNLPPEGVDPVGPSDGTDKVLRGGSVTDPPRLIRAALRSKTYSGRHRRTGLRPARTLP